MSTDYVGLSLMINGKSVSSSITLTGDAEEDREYIRRLAGMLYDDYLKTYKTKGE